MNNSEIVYDDDQDTWDNIYIIAYNNKIIVGEKFVIKEYAYSKDRKRYVVQDKDKKLEISGETDFNFSLKVGLYRQSKYDTYKKILESIDDQKRQREALELLDCCEQATHEPENYSLMLCNGSMQTMKGSLDMDRIDVFLYLLDSYYKKENELILSHCVFNEQNNLRNYLNMFTCKANSKDSIYVYCNEIYHISDKELIDDMIKSGRTSIKSPDRVVEYMKLAVRFWKAKYQYYQDIGIKNLELNEKMINLAENIL